MKKKSVNVNKRAAIAGVEDGGIFAIDKNSKTKIILSLLLILIIFIFGFYVFVKQKGKISEEGIFLIKASNEKIKFKPDNPGGLEVAFKDKYIYDHLTGKTILVKEKPLAATSVKLKKENIIEDIRAQLKNEGEIVLEKPKTVKNDDIDVISNLDEIIAEKVASKYYSRVAAIKSCDLEKEAWQILLSKYKFLESEKRKLSRDKASKICYIDVGPFVNEEKAKKLCEKITSFAKGRCKVVKTS